MWFYGSKLKMILFEIGEMELFEFFDFYIFYDLIWFFYEIISCRWLKVSRISIRVFLGNYKNCKLFLFLKENKLKYLNDLLKCGICK